VTFTTGSTPLGPLTLVDPNGSALNSATLAAIPNESARLALTLTPATGAPTELNVDASSADALAADITKQGAGLVHAGVTAERVPAAAKASFANGYVTLGSVTLVDPAPGALKDAELVAATDDPLHLLLTVDGASGPVVQALSVDASSPANFAADVNNKAGGKVTAYATPSDFVPPVASVPVAANAAVVGPLTLVFPSTTKVTAVVLDDMTNDPIHVTLDLTGVTKNLVGLSRLGADALATDINAKAAGAVTAYVTAEMPQAGLTSGSFSAGSEPAPPASATTGPALGPLTLNANSPGVWGNEMTAELRQSAGSGGSPDAPDYVDLVLSVAATGTPVPPTTRAALQALDASSIANLAAAINSKGSTWFTALPTGHAGEGAVPPDPGPIAFTGGADAQGGQPAQAASAVLPSSGLTLVATEAGAVGNLLIATLKSNANSPTLLDLVVSTVGRNVVETLANLATADLGTMAKTITANSAYVKAPAPGASGPITPGMAVFSGGQDASWNAARLANGMLAQLGADPDSPPDPVLLDQISPQVFNLMCLPDLAWLDPGVQDTVATTAQRFCENRQAFLIVDPPPPVEAGLVPKVLGGGPPGHTLDDIGRHPDQLSWLLNTWGGDFLGANGIAGATFYPWVQIADPWNKLLPRFVPPSGTIAGVFAQTDDARGVWKAPAGTAATLGGVTALADNTISDQINGDLNVVGINCLRTFPNYGNVVWGSRTLAGADVLDSTFKYVPVRRTADFIEQSLQQSLKWAVFEPNAAPLWTSIALEVGTFMAGLFAQGAFGGATAAQAYSVVCDGTTTSQADMLRGVVNIKVGYLPVEPAEFVVLHITVGAATAAAS
jgi:hypothetical protein